MTQHALRILPTLLFLAFGPAFLHADDAPKATGPFRHLKYRLVGPAAGGRVSRACGVPGDPTTYYLGAAGGGVWKTTDAGLTWKSIFDDQPTASIGAVAVAPSDPNVVYVGSGEANIRGNVQPGNGIYVSTNGGKSWKHVWKQKGQIGHLIVHPKNADIAFAAVLGSAFGPNPERGVYRTRDGGKTWKQVLKKDADTGAVDVCFDPNNPRVLVAALWQTRRSPWKLVSGGPGSGLYRSDDGGDTWKELTPGKHGLPAGPWGRIGVAIAPSDSRRVYALIEADKGGLYRSDDGGEKWELANPGRYLRQRAWYFSTVHVDPKNADVVWCCNVRLLRSTDAGRTFKNVKGPHHVDHHDLWIDPIDPRRMIDSNDGGVDITRNGGTSWHAPALPLSQFYHVSADNHVPYRVMGTMQDLGTASGPSNSLSSAGIPLCEWHTVGGGETGFVAADPSDPNIVYAGEYGGYISRYDHRTRQARNVSIYPFNPSGRGAGELKYRFQWTAPILVSRHDPKVIYHAANVLFRTRDAGTHWDRVSPDLTRDDKSKQLWSGGPITGDNTGAEYYCTIFALAESPVKAGVLWVGSDDGLVHVSRDNAKTWHNVTKNVPGLPQWGTVCCIEASPHDAATAYLVVEAHRLDDDRPYLWKTTDYGKTWVSLTKGLPPGDYLHAVREDPKRRGLLFVGSEQHVSYSPDDGATWHRLKLNMPTAAISDLVVKDDDLVVATNGRSLWIMDDLTPIRLGANPPAKAPQLFPIRPAIRWRYHGESYAGDDRIPGDNPPRGMIVNYFLPAEPKRDLVLEIFDARDRLVTKLTSKQVKSEEREDGPDTPWHIFKPTVLPNKPGVQRVAWDLTYQGPKTIPGAKNDAGTPHRGPLAAPGKYSVRLTIEGKVLSGSAEIRPDPRDSTPATDRTERLELALKLRDDITKVSEMVIALRSARKQISQRVETLKDQANASKVAAWIGQARTLQKKLDALEEKLHNPRAEVAYDILAMKGGAKLYSQLAPLLSAVMDNDGPVTQGMREVYTDLASELAAAAAEWRSLQAEDLTRLNRAAEALALPAILVPRTK